MPQKRNILDRNDQSNDLNRNYRKRREIPHQDEHHGEGPWIVSYADMMTLLFCFFVILTSLASFDPIVMARKSAKMAEHFGNGKQLQDGEEINGLGLEIGGHPNLKGIVNPIVKDGTLQLVFSSSIMFSPGEVEIENNFIKNVDIIVGLIKNKNPDYRIIVEGHTDNSPLSPEHTYRSNWELSSARAASVVERFLYYNFKPNQLVSVGFGDSRPIAPNFDKFGNLIKENQALNRRVVIKVLKSLNSTRMKNLGIDSYFEDSEIIHK